MNQGIGRQSGIFFNLQNEKNTIFMKLRRNLFEGVKLMDESAVTFIIFSLRAYFWLSAGVLSFGPG
jgi:hypothetical protein